MVIAIFVCVTRARCYFYGSIFNMFHATTNRGQIFHLLQTDTVFVELTKRNITPSQLLSEFFYCPVLASVRIVRGTCTSYARSPRSCTAAVCNGKFREINAKMLMDCDELVCKAVFIHKK